MKLIAEGRTAEVYEWQNGHILKLFRKGFDNAEYEAKMARLVVESGVDAPQIIETVNVSGRTGIVYERVHGQDMLAKFRENPQSIMKIAKQFADIHAEMHTQHAPELTPVKRKLAGKINNAPQLTQAQKRDVIAYMETLPDDDVVCHGDFHPENIILTPGGAKIIDWIDVTAGNPAADVARSIIILTIGNISGGFAVRWLFAGVRSLFCYAYLKRYYAITSLTRKVVQRWMVPVAAGRLDEGIEPAEPLLRIIDKGLKS